MGKRNFVRISGITKECVMVRKTRRKPLIENSNNEKKKISEKAITGIFERNSRCLRLYIIY